MGLRNSEPCPTSSAVLSSCRHVNSNLQRILCMHVIIPKSFFHCLQNLILAVALSPLIQLAEGADMEISESYMCKHTFNCVYSSHLETDFILFQCNSHSPFFQVACLLVALAHSTRMLWLIFAAIIPNWHVTLPVYLLMAPYRESPLLKSQGVG